MRQTLGVIIISLVVSTSAFSSYRLRIPNGLNVKGYGAVGHVNKYGGGQPTQFGIDFERAGARWTKALCEMDSDKDGATNGEELGDPCCTWRVGLPTKPHPTSPGHFNDFTSEELDSLRCSDPSPGNPQAPSTESSTPEPASITNAGSRDDYSKEL